MGFLRIGFTGAPFAGKTEASQSLAHLGNVTVLPEVANALYLCGFPKCTELQISYRKWVRAFRHIFVPARFSSQRALEDAKTLQAQFTATRAVVCDRTMLDGVVYYERPEQFFPETRSSLEAIVTRYDLVLFFESPVVKGIPVGYDRCMPVDWSKRAHKLLCKLWCSHPGFRYLPVTESFEEKIANAVRIIEEVL